MSWFDVRAAHRLTFFAVVGTVSVAMALDGALMAFTSLPIWSDLAGGPLAFATVMWPLSAVMRTRLRSATREDRNQLFDLDGRSLGRWVVAGNAIVLGLLIAVVILGLVAR